MDHRQSEDTFIRQHAITGYDRFSCTLLISCLGCKRRLLHDRRKGSAIRLGRFQFVPPPPGVHTDHSPHSSSEAAARKGGFVVEARVHQGVAERAAVQPLLRHHSAVQRVKVDEDQAHTWGHMLHLIVDCTSQLGLRARSHHQVDSRPASVDQLVLQWTKRICSCDDVCSSVKLAKEDDCVVQHLVGRRPATHSTGAAPGCCGSCRTFPPPHLQQTAHMHTGEASSGGGMAETYLSRSARPATEGWRGPHLNPKTCQHAERNAPATSSRMSW